MTSGFFARFARLSELSSAIIGVIASMAASAGASLVGFVHDSPDAVAETVQSQARRYVGAKSFGAVADGVADDTAALQKVIDYCIVTGCGLWLDPGTYRTTASLLVDSASGLVIRGPGSLAVIKGDAAGTHILILCQRSGFTSMRGIKFEDFVIDGNGGGQLDAGLLQLNNCEGFQVRGLWVQNGTRTLGSSGINGITCSAGTPGGKGSSGVIEACSIRATSKAAINATSECEQIVAVFNDIRDISGNGTAPGIQVNGAFKVRLIANHIQDTQGPGISVGDDGLANPPRDAIIMGNVIERAGSSSLTEGDAIRIKAVANATGRITVADNICLSSGTPVNGGSGIYCIGTENLMIRGNQCHFNQFDGVRLQSCAGATVQGNRCNGNNQAGVAYAGGVQAFGVCPNLYIAGNHCTDMQAVRTQSYGVILAGASTFDDLQVDDNHLAGNVLGPMLALSGGARMSIGVMAERQTVDGALQNAIYFAMADLSSVSVMAHGVGKQADSTNAGKYAREALFRRNGAGAVQVGATAALGTDFESNAAWGGVVIVPSGNSVAVQVAGAAATTVDWRVKVSMLGL